MLARRLKAGQHGIRRCAQAQGHAHRRVPFALYVAQLVKHSPLLLRLDWEVPIALLKNNFGNRIPATRTRHPPRLNSCSRFHVRPPGLCCVDGITVNAACNVVNTLVKHSVDSGLLWAYYVRNMEADLAGRQKKSLRGAVLTPGKARFVHFRCPETWRRYLDEQQAATGRTITAITLHALALDRAFEEGLASRRQELRAVADDLGLSLSEDLPAVLLCAVHRYLDRNRGVGGGK